jgi:DNA-binding LacI/PurR family transcriptional regulator
MAVLKANENVSVHADVKERMVEFLREKRIPVNGKLPPLRELSGKFNVSLATIRKAVLSLEESGELSVRHGSGVYVVDKHGELVVETTILRPFRGNKTICVIDSFARGDLEGHYLDNFVLSETLQGAKEACLKSKWGLKVLSFVIGEGEQAILQKIAECKGDVALMVVTQHFLNLLDSVEKMGVPVVVLGPSGTKTYKNEVCIDLFEAGVLAGDHLAELGHQKVLYIGQHPAVAKTSYLRHSGFCYAHKKVFPQGEIHEIFVSDTTDSSKLRQLFLGAAQKALEFINSVSAIFISSEQIALTVMPYLLQHGVRIPETVSLVTLDNSRFAKLFTPMWTSIDLNRPGAAITAFELLSACDNGSPVSPFFKYFVPSRLVIRDSAVSWIQNKKETSVKE